MTNLTASRTHLSRASIGAICGAMIAIIWLVFDANAVLVLAALTGFGALIGVALDRPDRLIELLERLRDR